MAINLESFRSERLDFRRAPVDIEGLVALAAEKVMMVGSLSEFIPYAASGELHFGEPPRFKEDFKVPVNRGESERGDQPLAVCKYLIDGEGPTCIKEDPANCPSLASILFHPGAIGQDR